MHVPKRTVTALADQVPRPLAVSLIGRTRELLHDMHSLQLVCEQGLDILLSSIEVLSGT